MLIFSHQNDVILIPSVTISVESSVTVTFIGSIDNNIDKIIGHCSLSLFFYLNCQYPWSHAASSETTQQFQPINRQLFLIGANGKKVEKFPGVNETVFSLKAQSEKTTKKHYF